MQDMEVYGMNICQDHSEEDDLLFHSLNDCFGVCLTFLDFDKNSENWQIDLRYERRSNRE